MSIQLVGTSGHSQGARASAARPHISLIIPVRNEERYIGACLRAILAQDYPRELMEIIVVDGMSTDRTRDLLDAFAAKDSRIRVLLSPKRRTPFSMNIGVAAATGEILVRVDGHSVIGPDHVRACVEYLVASGADHVGGLMRSVGRSYVARTIALAVSSPFGVGSARFRYTHKEQAIDTVPFGAYRRETMLRLGGFDEHFPIGQDSELDYRILLAGGQVRIDPAISTDYYCRDSLRLLALQFFRYGRAKAHILHKHGSLPSPRALAPAAALLAFALLSLAAPFETTVRPLVGGIGVAYLLLCVAAGVLVSRHERRCAALLPLAFITLHVSHGAGFLSALPALLQPRPADRRHGSLVPPGEGVLARAGAAS